jgi:hypothetical protein
MPEFVLQLDMEVPIYQESEKVQMRKWVVNSILESEKSYVAVLSVLKQVSELISRPPQY